MRRPAVAAHETLRNPPVARVAQQSIALLQPCDLVEHFQCNPYRTDARLPRGKGVHQDQEIGTPPRMIIVKQQPVAPAPLMHPPAKPDNFRSHKDRRPGPKQHSAEAAIDDLNHAIVPPAKHFRAVGEIGNCLKHGHESSLAQKRPQIALAPTGGSCETMPPNYPDKRGCAGATVPFRLKNSAQRVMRRFNVLISLGEMRLVAAIVSPLVLVGCLGQPLPPYQPVTVAYDNPVSIPIANYELVWEGVRDVVAQNFRIEYEQPLRPIGNTILDGRIDTFPMPGATLLEPWLHDSANEYERLESTLQSIRRYAVVKIILAQNGGFWVDVAVYKELENLKQPEFFTRGLCPPSAPMPRLLHASGPTSHRR